MVTLCLSPTVHCPFVLIARVFEFLTFNSFVSNLERFMIFCQVYYAWPMESRVHYQQDEAISIFAVLHLGEPPRKLAR